MGSLVWFLFIPQDLEQGLTRLVYLICQSCLTLCDPTDFSPPGSSVLGVLQERTLEPCPPPGDLSNPGIKPRSPALQVDSLPTEPPGKPQTHEKLPGKAVYSKSEIGLLYSKLCVEVFSDLRELYKCADALRPNSNG